MGKKVQPTSQAVNSRARAVAWALPSIRQWQRDCIVASGGDPSVVPEDAFRFVRLNEVRQLVGLSRSSIYRLVSESRFPAPVALCTVATRR